MSDNLIGATTAIFYVRLSNAAADPVDVQWATRDGSAIGGIDYKPAKGVVTFLPGETEKQIEVLVYGQHVTPADDKVFFINLSPPSNAVLMDVLLTCRIVVDDSGEVPVTSIVVAEGRRGPKGAPGLSSYELAVYMGEFAGTIDEWMEKEANAARAAERAEAAAVAANIAGKVYSTPGAGVNPNTGVPFGDYFNVRSPLSTFYVDEYQNVGGAAVPTGKSYPSAKGLMDVQAIAEQSAAIAEAAATAATIGAGVFDTPEAGVDPSTGVPVGAYFNVRSSNDESYVDEYQNLNGNAVATGKSYLSAYGVERQEKPASTIKDASGRDQQTINNALTDGYAYVEWFGNTTTDATNAINMCLIYCATYNKTAKSISGKTYPCFDTVRISTSCDFTGSTFVFPASTATVAVDIRKEVSGASVLFENVRIKLPIITNNRNYGTVPVAGSIGVKITGLRDSEVIFNSIRGFENNLQLYSNDVNVYIAYNDFRFNGLFVSSKVNIHMFIEDQGWINQCIWYGGHFAQVSVDRAAYNAINLKLTKPAKGGNNPPNGHTFIGCSLEGDFYRTIDYDFDPTLSISYYSCNTFVNCRFEAALALRLHNLALYDTFICCSGLSHATFINEARPNAIGSPRFSNFKLDVAALVGNTGFRTSKSTHMFQAENSAGAMVLSAAFQNVINGGLLGSGSYVLFDTTNATKTQPILRLSFEGGLPSIAMGNGSDAPTSRLYYYGDTQWRHTFSLSPATDNALNLGDSDRKYANIHAVKANLSGGLGVFGTTPPATKRSITGKKTPTTIAEQNAVLDSIVSALVAYGLVSDGRTV